jgi:hypothetical protein
MRTIISLPHHADGELGRTPDATSKEATPGGYYGPDGLGETRGHPQSARIPPQPLDRVTGRRLWELSQRVTGLEIRLP